MTRASEGDQREMPMDFQAFLFWRSRVADKVGVETLCETRIARALASYRPTIVIPEVPRAVHRCDLVRLWGSVRGYPSELAGRTLACEGVRHGLEIVLGVLARQRTVVAIPCDVYPVYSTLASRAGVTTHIFATFPDFDLQRILAEATNASCTHVLLPLPLKLHGRGWSDEEVAIAERWLFASQKRRLILDGIYSLGTSLGSELTRLLATGQVLLLDSLSKGWLAEQIFGVAVVPENDLALYSSAFRMLQRSNHKLFTAHELLVRSPQLPCRLEQYLACRREDLIVRLSGLGRRVLNTDRGYFVAIQACAKELLAEHAIVAIPATAFGSGLREWSIVSALPAVPPQP